MPFIQIVSSKYHNHQSSSPIVVPWLQYQRLRAVFESSFKYSPQYASAYRLAPYLCALQAEEKRNPASQEYPFSEEGVVLTPRDYQEFTRFIAQESSRIKAMWIKYYLNDLLSITAFEHRVDSQGESKGVPADPFRRMKPDEQGHLAQAFMAALIGKDAFMTLPPREGDGLNYVYGDGIVLPMTRASILSFLWHAGRLDEGAGPLEADENLFRGLCFLLRQPNAREAFSLSKLLDETLSLRLMARRGAGRDHGVKEKEETVLLALTRVLFGAAGMVGNEAPSTPKLIAAMKTDATLEGCEWIYKTETLYTGAVKRAFVKALAEHAFPSLWKRIWSMPTWDESRLRRGEQANRIMIFERNFAEELIDELQRYDDVHAGRADARETLLEKRLAMSAKLFKILASPIPWIAELPEIALLMAKAVNAAAGAGSAVTAGMAGALSFAEYLSESGATEASLTNLAEGELDTPRQRGVKHNTLRGCAIEVIAKLMAIEVSYRYSHVLGQLLDENHIVNFARQGAKRVAAFCKQEGNNVSTLEECLAGLMFYRSTLRARIEKVSLRTVYGEELTDEALYREGAIEVEGAGEVPAQGEEKSAEQAGEGADYFAHPVLIEGDKATVIGAEAIAPPGSGFPKGVIRLKRDTLNGQGQTRMARYDEETRLRLDEGHHAELNDLYSYTISAKDLKEYAATLRLRAETGDKRSPTLTALEFFRERYPERRAFGRLVYHGTVEDLDLTDMVLDGCDFRGVTFRNCTFGKVSFKGAYLQQVKMRQCDNPGEPGEQIAIDFSEADCSYGDFEGMDLVHCTIHNAVFYFANLRGVQFPGELTLSVTAGASIEGATSKSQWLFGQTRLLSDRITRMGGQVDRVVKRVDVLEERVDEHDDKFGEVKTENAELKAKNEQLEAKSERLEAKSERLEAKNNKLEADVTAGREELTALSLTLAERDRTIAEQSARIDNLERNDRTQQRQLKFVLSLLLRMPGGGEALRENEAPLSPRTHESIAQALSRGAVERPVRLLLAPTVPASEEEPEVRGAFSELPTPRREATRTPLRFFENASEAKTPQRGQSPASDSDSGEEDAQNDLPVMTNVRVPER